MTAVQSAFVDWWAAKPKMKILLTAAAPSVLAHGDPQHTFLDVCFLALLTFVVYLVATFALWLLVLRWVGGFDEITIPIYLAILLTLCMLALHVRNRFTRP